MPDNRKEAFRYFSDYNIPAKLKKIMQQAKKEGKGSPISIVVCRDREGNQYEIWLSRDREAAERRFLKGIKMKELILWDISSRR
jgi:hypothetical protein